MNSGGGGLLVVIFHAAQSFFAVVNEGITPEQQMWLEAGCGLALVLFIGFGTRLTRQLG